MIYGYEKIVEWASNGGVTPYDIACVGPSSVDLRLGSEFIEMLTKKRMNARTFKLYPGYAVLASTIEYVRLPKNVSGLLCLKSSLARMGLDHSLAGWVDSGFEGELTLELYSHIPLELHFGQRIVQLVLMETIGAMKYNGLYVGQIGPTLSKLS